MRLPRIRFRLRTLLLLLAVVALGLVGHRVYRDGPETHWLLLKLRHWNIEARRAAALQVRQSEGNAMLQDIVGSIFSGPANPQTSEAHRLRRARRAELLLPVLLGVIKDPDAGCRANALRALVVLASQGGSDSEKSLALGRILESTRDRDDTVRVAVVSSLAGLASQVIEGVLGAIRSALTDPSVEVRQSAARELGMLGVLAPESQPEIASILIPLLAGREEPRVRVQAAWGMCHFGKDLARCR